MSSSSSSAVVATTKTSSGSAASSSSARSSRRLLGNNNGAFHNKSSAKSSKRRMSVGDVKHHHRQRPSFISAVLSHRHLEDQSTLDLMLTSVHEEEESEEHHLDTAFRVDENILDEGDHNNNENGEKQNGRQVKRQTNRTTQTMNQENHILQDKIEEGQAVIIQNPQNKSIGMHLLERNVFTLEVVRNQMIRFAIYLIYGVFVLSIVFQFLHIYTFNEDDRVVQFAVRPENASSTDPICYPRQDGTCEPFQPKISVEQADLLANTVVVSNGLNVSDWEGTGAKPGSPPFGAFDFDSGIFMAGPSSLEYSANPQFHAEWNDITAVSWLGVSEGGTYKLRTVYFDLRFEKLDGDWPDDMDELPFPVEIEGYGCVWGANCSNIGDWRIMMIRHEVRKFPLRSVDGNFYEARVAVYFHFLMGQIVKAQAWRFTILADPYGAVSSCLSGQNCQASIKLWGYPNRSPAVRYVELVVYICYFCFMIWWLRALFKHSGKMKKWATEDVWLFVSGIGFLMYTSIIIVSLQLSAINIENYTFRESLWVAGLLVSHVGLSLVLFVFACFCDAPRRLVMSKRRFYGFKICYSVVTFIGIAGATICRFPGATRDESGTDSQLGGVDYVTAPENWTRHDQAMYCGFMILFLTCLFVGFAYYVLANFRTKRILQSLPYAVTRPLQLSCRFFFWATSIWVFVTFLLLIADIVRSVEQDQDYNSKNMDRLSRLTVILYTIDSFDGLRSTYNLVFGIVFFCVFQILFLPPKAFFGSEGDISPKTHYMNEEEAQQEQDKEKSPKYIMVLQRARLLMLCSREVYIYFDEEEARQLSGDTVDAANATNGMDSPNVNARTTEESDEDESLPHRSGKMDSLSLPPPSKMEKPETETRSGEDDNANLNGSKIAPQDSVTSKPAAVTFTADTKDPVDSGSILPHHKGKMHSLGLPPRSEKVDYSLAMPPLSEMEESVPTSREIHRDASTSSIELDLSNSSERFAGAPGPHPDFLDGESTYDMGYRVVARISEPEEVNLHDTRAMILRHVESGDLVVAFRGTMTPKQMKTDVMMSKIMVNLDTFLAVRPKKKLHLCLPQKERKSPEAIEACIRNGEQDAAKLLDLLHTDDDDPPPDFLRGARKSSVQVTGYGWIHFGFWSSYSRVRKNIHNIVREELLKRPGRLLVTGHSLGGALGTLCVYDMQRWVIPTVRYRLIMQSGRSAAELVTASCYTFGSPRTGNELFVRAYNKIVPDTQRIVNDGDAVTGNPLAILGYSHVGRENIFDSTGCVRVNPSLVEHQFTQQRRKVDPHFCSSYRDVIEKSFFPIVSEDDLLNRIRKACGLPYDEACIFKSEITDRPAVRRSTVATEEHTETNDGAPDTSGEAVDVNDVQPDSDSQHRSPSQFDDAEVQDSGDEICGLEIVTAEPQAEKGFPAKSASLIVGNF